MGLDTVVAAVAGPVLQVVPPAVVGALAPLDKTLGLPENTALVVALLVLTLAFARIIGRLFDGGSTKHQRRGDTVLFVGLCGAGKTAMFHQMVFGTKPATVTSMAEAVFRGPLHTKSAKGSGDVNDAKAPQQFTFVDFPGHPRLRGGMSAHAGRARAVVLVVDSVATDPDTIRRCAELLYDLFTSPAFVDQLPPLLVACNKADADGAQSCEHVKKLLESALELLKVTRASLGSTGDGDDALRLGRPGAPFEFDVDAPCEVEFAATAVTSTPPRLQPVLEFVDTCMERE